MGHGRRFHDARVERNTAQQRYLNGIAQARKLSLPKVSPECRIGSWEVRHLLTRVAENRHPTRMSILNIENWVLARVLDDFGEIEIEHRVVLAVQHIETNGVAADLIYHLSQGDEFACPFRHLYRLASSQQADELHKFHVQFGFATADRIDRGLHALDVAAMIGAPNVDEIQKSTVNFRSVIGNVGREIRVAAI